MRIRHDGADAWTPDGVDALVAPGETLLVLGPSGCGKSTFALALNGLIPHAIPARLEGTVLVSGVDTGRSWVADLSERVGMVFQDPDAQIVTGTVLDDVCFGPENRLLPVAEVLERAERALRAVGLWERRADDPETLSGGGKQRLAIACALALDAPLLVLDEPTANLDPAGTEELYRLLAGLDRAVVLVEHNLDAAMSIVDSVLVLVLDAGGRVVARGPAAEVLRERAEELLELGVWLPTATLAALRLRQSGVALDPLPVTPEELATGLAALPGAVGAATTTRPAPPAPPPDAAAAVVVRDLTLRRGRIEVLHSLSLTMGRGDFVAVVGPNGAGKTTLAQAIAGLLPTPRGTVAADRAGFVFQNPEHQFVRHSVADELAFSLRGRPAEEVAERVDAMLATLDLTAQREAHPFLLSGGQKRRLSVGTALIAGAPLLVLDEPTFGQDRARASELLETLSRLNAGGATVIIVTHDLDLASEHASHIAVIADGRLAAHSTTKGILGDAGLLRRTGLRQPPLGQALAGPGIPAALRGITRLRDLPGGAL
ncbi:ABC transporter ATP-binding protein [Leifsonia xyli subsp. cynodontis DSM 46306]|uniref:ABC transporter domain-containing protein n=1 Tax=Leifsonia xyli subsp. cynodontis DSM 46306 TaxID=1389489 RepID=U3PA93_LEIXC|nr:ABC transporter ATP-binding protein [Leifsonia xyli subsp. cynodontis DSM 46306]